MSPNLIADLLPGLYLLALTEGLALLLRRFFDPLPLRLRLAFFTVLVVLFGRVLFGGSILLPLDNLRTAVPFRELAPSDPPGHGLQGDLVHQIGPWLGTVRATLKGGGWPLWRPGAGAGMPLLADPQAQAFQPLVLAALPLPLWPSIGVIAALRVWTAMAFLFLLLRREGLALPAASAGAFAYGLSGFLMLWLGWPMATCAALLPVALYGLALVDERGLRRDGAFFALALAALLLGGHPETMLYALGVVAAFLLARAWRRKGRAALRLLLASAGALLFAGGLTSPVLLPSLDYLPQTERAAAVSQRLDGAPPPGGGLGGAWSSEPTALRAWRDRALRRLAAIPAPGAFGTLDFYWGPVNAIEDGGGFVGGVAGLLALLALLPTGWRRRSGQERVVMAILGMSLLLIAQPDGLDRLLVHLPGLRATLAHKNHRILMLVAFSLSYFAACGLDRYLGAARSVESKRKTRWIWIAAGLLGLLTALPYLAWPPGGRFGLTLASQAGTLAFHLGALALAALILARPWRLSHRAASWSLVVLIAGELVWSSRSVNPPAPARLAYPNLPAIRFLRANLGTMRMVGVGNSVFSANFPAAYGLRDARINNPALPLAYAGATSPVLRYSPSGIPIFVRPTHPLYDLLGVRYVLARPGVPIDLPLVFSDRSAWIYERPHPLPRLFLPARVMSPKRGTWIDFLARNPDFAARAVVDESPWSGDPGRALKGFDGIKPKRPWKAAQPADSWIAVRSESATWIRGHSWLIERRLLASNVFQDRHWRILADGRPQAGVLTNGTFAGAWLPAGTERVDLLYRSAPWWGGCLLAALALALGAAACIRPPGRGTAPVGSDGILRPDAVPQAGHAALR